MRNFMVASLVSALMLSAIAPVRGQEDWRAYQQRLEQSRQAAQQRYDQWLRERQGRYQTWRDAQGNDRDRVLELQDSGLQPGSYTVRLPFGLGLRVNVPEGAKPALGWGDRVYGDVHYRAKQIEGHLRELQRELHRGGQAELLAEVTKIQEQCAGLATAAAARRPAEEIRQQFTEFDELWHPLSHRLAHGANLGGTISQRAQTIDQWEEGLHQILTIAPAPPYDRPLVAALTSELANATEHLLEDVTIDPRQTLDAESFTRRAQRVKRQAADLDAAVRQNASFATIVEEYEEFDRVWHRLVEQARVSPEVDAHLRRVSRQVNQIDRQLHRELYVSVPTAGDRQQLQQLSASIAKTAEHLADDIDAETGRKKQDIAVDARSFAADAHDLQHALASRGPREAEQRALAELRASWKRLYSELAALKGDRFEHSQAMAEQLAEDIQHLDERMRS